MSETVEAVPTTGAEVKRAEDAARYARERVGDAERALAERRGRIARGEDARTAERLRMALANEALMASAKAADRADAGLYTAEADQRKCRSRGYRETALAGERRNAVIAMRRVVAEAVAAFDAALVPTGLAPIGERREHALKDGLRRAEELSVEGGLPGALERAREDAAKAEAEAEDVRARRIPAAAVEALARGVEADGRALLARLVGGYEPKPATVKKEPLYAVLGDAGLIDVAGRGARPTRLGIEVAAWAAENLVERTAFHRPLAPADWTRGHTTAERRAMAERVLTALAALDADGGPADHVEVGDPDAGYSYRLVGTRENLVWFHASLRLPPPTPAARGPGNSPAEEALEI